MLNIGPQELLVVLIVALVIVGPQRLPELARTIGKGLREFRKVQDEVRDMVSTGLGDEIKDAKREIASAVEEVRGTGRQVGKDLASASGDIKAATDVQKLLPSRAHRTRRPASGPARETGAPPAEPREPSPSQPPPSSEPPTAQPTGESADGAS